jgi:PAS domain S-box-containing protein
LVADQLLVNAIATSPGNPASVAWDATNVSVGGKDIARGHASSGGAAMHESELFAFLENTADAAFAVDDRGIVCSWNAAAERLFGYPRAAVVGGSCVELFQGRDVLGTLICTEPCDVRICAAACRDIANYDMETRTAAGRPLWINVSIVVFRDGRTGRRLVVHLARDAKNRKRNERLTQDLVALARELVRISDPRPALPPISPLTPRETKVLGMLTEGRSAAELARVLRISPRTVRTHIHHINHKLHARNRLEAVMHAIRRGLIDPPAPRPSRQRSR